MFHFFHTFQPNPILLSAGPITIYWYGLLIALGILLATLISVKIAKKYQIKPDQIFDLAFWLVIFGIIGARLYETLLFPSYYWGEPINVLKIWEGGLAIHGGIIAGIIVVYFFAKKYKHSFWKLAAIITPGLALAQALGRIGNYFNSELFGLPTSLPWGIPIDLMSRPIEYISAEYFHPTFLYEAIGSIIIFIVLWWFNQKKKNPLIITCIYLIAYSVLRFFLEFIRIDETPILFLRVPQIISLIIIIIATILIIKRKKIYAQEK
jgi:phosphatidylglycerol:prolipoprotein diacylglycerol transferase